MSVPLIAHGRNQYTPKRVTVSVATFMQNEGFSKVERAKGSSSHLPKG